MCSSYCCLKRMEIMANDVCNAFLNDNINETIMIKQPPGFEDVNHPQKVCLLRKALYGLKQVPRSWYAKLTNLFTLNRNSKQVWIIVYVDDLIFTSNCIHAVNSITKLVLNNSNVEILAF